MTPYERLMSEAIPTRPPKPTYEPWTPEEQAAHREALDAELAAIARERRQQAAA